MLKAWSDFLTKACCVSAHAAAGRLDDELRLVRVRGRIGRESAQWWGLAAAGERNGRPDDAEALALATHQLRQGPDYATALSLPLPLHLAGLAEAYVLPTISGGDRSDEQEADDSGDEVTRTELSESAQDLDPGLSDAVSLAEEPDPHDQLSLF
ncbi:RNaseH domain-containing protein [Streptomyces xiamenensis]